MFVYIYIVYLLLEKCAKQFSNLMNLGQMYIFLYQLNLETSTVFIYYFKMNHNCHDNKIDTLYYLNLTRIWTKFVSTQFQSNLM